MSRGRTSEAKGTPLSVRMPCGRPNSLNVRSKTVNANFSCVVDGASHVISYRLAKPVIVSGEQ
jgi:hypothetical protein